MASIVCGECGKNFKNQHGLNIHRAQAHRDAKILVKDGVATPISTKKVAKRRKNKRRAHQNGEESIKTVRTGTDRRHRALVMDLVRRLLIELEHI